MVKYLFVATLAQFLLLLLWIALAWIISTLFSYYNIATSLAVISSLVIIALFFVYLKWKKGMSLLALLISFTATLIPPSLILLSAIFRPHWVSDTSVLDIIMPIAMLFGFGLFFVGVVLYILNIKNKEKQGSSALFLMVGFVIFGVAVMTWGFAQVFSNTFSISAMPNFIIQ